MIAILAAFLQKEPLWSTTTVSRARTVPPSQTALPILYAHPPLCAPAIFSLPRTDNGESGFAGSLVPTLSTPDDVLRRTTRDTMMIFRISDSVRRIGTPDGGVLLDVERGQMFGLNVVGATILELIERGYDEPRLIEEIRASYPVDEHVLCSDLIEFLEILLRHHIIKPSQAPAAT